MSRRRTPWAIAVVAIAFVGVAAYVVADQRHQSTLRQSRGGADLKARGYDLKKLIEENNRQTN